MRHIRSRPWFEHTEPNISWNLYLVMMLPHETEQWISKSEFLKISSYPPTSLLSLVPISANGTTIYMGTQVGTVIVILLFLHAFHLITHQFLSILPLRFSLNLPSSLSASALVQALIISLLGSTRLLTLYSCPLAVHPSYHDDSCKIWFWFCYSIL